MTALRSLLGSIAAVALTLTACGSNATSEPAREYVLHLRMDDDTEEYVYIAEDPIDIRVGDRVNFEVRNDGTLDHDLQVVGPDGLAVATADAVGPAQSLMLTVDFDETGIYQLNCLVDNHLTEHGMQALVQVTEPDA